MNIKIDIYLIMSLIILTIFKQVESFMIFYTFIMLHELIHIITARVLQIKVIEVSFLPFGVNAKFNFKNNKIKEIIVASAGPIFSLIMSICFEYYKVENLFIFITNILPIYPLDGGRILKNIMKLVLGSNKGIKVYNSILKAAIIVLVIINIILVVYLKNYKFIFVSIYIFQIAGEEIKKDKIRTQIVSTLNIEI